MKIHPGYIALAALIAIGGVALAETVHQTVTSSQIRTGDGGNAVKKGKMETQKADGAADNQVARVKGDMTQWGYVAAWFGMPAPAGKSIARVRVYVDGQKTAKYMLYAKGSSDQIMLGELKIPDDAKPNTFVDVDLPVTSQEEWSGLIIKKADKSTLPSPWIDKVSIVLPD